MGGERERIGRDEVAARVQVAGCVDVPIIGCGGQIVVQDEATSVVWGMPGSVAQAGLAQHVLPLPDIADHILRVAQRGTSSARNDVALGARS